VRSTLALLALVLLSGGLVGCAPSSRTAPVPRGLEKIDHFVFIIQENRSFDHYFGTYPGADGLPTGVTVPDSKGAKIGRAHV
jgi:phospholipase C